MTNTTAFLTDSTCAWLQSLKWPAKNGMGSLADGFEWSGLSYDNTTGLGHSTWRHVKFIENGTLPGLGGNAPEKAAWAFSSDVCKHCGDAGCLEACPTGADIPHGIWRVFLQPDVCNGCRLLRGGPVRLVSSSAIQMMAAPSNALFVTTAKSRDSSPLAPPSVHRIHQVWPAG